MQKKSAKMYLRRLRRIHGVFYWSFKIKIDAYDAPKRVTERMVCTPKFTEACLKPRILDFFDKAEKTLKRVKSPLRGYDLIVYRPLKMFISGDCRFKNRTQ
jgi:hypothetical protein